MYLFMNKIVSVIPNSKMKSENLIINSYPQLAQEWDSSKNGDKTPQNITRLIHKGCPAAKNTNPLTTENTRP